MNKIEEAKQFIITQAEEPALASETLPKSIRDSVQSTKHWIENFKRVGDLYRYLNRFDGNQANEIYDALRADGLVTYEDILPEFNRRYSYWADDVSTLTDFVIGDEYTSYDIGICARHYNNLTGILPLESENGYEAVIIKANLTGGTYANEWLEKDRHLKYYLKSLKGVFKQSYKDNSAIIDNPGIPIYAFVRQTNTGPFTFKGIFYYENVVEEEDGSMWFSLRKNPNIEPERVITSDELQNELNEDIRKSRNLNADERQRRLANAPKKAQKVTTQTTGYKRNPDVIAEVLARANGVCEKCNNPAPFMRRTNNEPYLEVHHIIPLAQDGEDTVENALALCPNCHREAHYG